MILQLLLLSILTVACWYLWLTFRQMILEEYAAPSHSRDAEAPRRLQPSSPAGGNRSTKERP